MLEKLPRGQWWTALTVRNAGLLGFSDGLEALDLGLLDGVVDLDDHFPWRAFIDLGDHADLGVVLGCLDQF